MSESNEEKTNEVPATSPTQETSKKSKKKHKKNKKPKQGADGSVVENQVELVNNTDGSVLSGIPGVESYQLDMLKTLQALPQLKLSDGLLKTPKLTEGEFFCWVMFFYRFI
jgi:hypothetical protein